MLFIPKKTKFKKQQKGKFFNRITKPSALEHLKYGTIALKALESGRVTSVHLLACRQVINKTMKKLGQVKINVISDTPISKKPNEMRMGKGKGPVDHWIAKIQSGCILFEIETSHTIVAIKALTAAQFKLPLMTKIIKE